MTRADGNDLIDALRAFEAAEANIVRLETLWAAIEEEFPKGNVFAPASPEYEDRCRAYEEILDALPAIDAWRPTEKPLPLADVNDLTIGAREVGDVESHMSLHEHLAAPGRDLREYRYRLNRQRRHLVRQLVVDSIASIDKAVEALQPISSSGIGNERVSSPDFALLREAVEGIDTLLGSVKRPSRWTELKRHLHFGLVADLQDIVRFDWPAVRSGLQAGLYAPDEPIPVGVTDLATLVRSGPKGKIPTKLHWERLSPEDFERLAFSLIAAAPEYENPQWLMRTNAPDRGRDLSVTLVNKDSLGGTRRSRVAIQCRSGMNVSVSATDVSTLRDQMVLWDSPRVDILVIATTGRFTADAVSMIEKHNQSDRALRIDMWAESHLEGLLSERPAVIAEFNLR